MLIFMLILITLSIIYLVDKLSLKREPYLEVWIVINSITIHKVYYMI